MDRLISLLLIVFMTASGVSAHAGMLVSAIDENDASSLVQVHENHQMMAMDHSVDLVEDHSGHQLGCGMGHCAIACGFILQQFAFSAPEAVSIVETHVSELRLVGGILAFEPPPPKV